MPKVRTLDAAELSAAREIVPALRVQDLVIYDGECRFCIAQVERLVRLAGHRSDGNPWLARQPLQAAAVLAAVGLDHDAAMVALHLVTVEGAIYRGVEGVVQALRHRPLLGRLLLLYYIPGLRQLADLGYRIVARYRYYIMGRAVARGECDGGSCQLHLPRRT